MAYENLFADPLAAIGYGLLTDGQNPLGTGMQVLQQGSAEKADRELKSRLYDMKAQSYANGSHLPAALQLANEYEKAMADGDTERANNITAFSKVYEKGIGYDPNTNSMIPMRGYGEAVGSIEGTKAGMEQQAKKDVDLTMNPQIKEAESFSGIVGKQRGEEMGALTRMESKLPELQATVAKLGALSEDATYTMAGQAVNFASKELGLGSTEGAKARASYIAIVDNQILPLLRDTFGAAFTAKEGDTLKATLGDPNKTPAEKQVVLEAFIEQKAASIESKRRELGVDETQPTQPTQPENLPTATNPQTGEKLILRNGQWESM